MRYRDIEYTVVQGIERGVWKWTASVAVVVVMGQVAVNLRRAPRPRRQLIGHSPKQVESGPTPPAPLTEASYRRSASSGCQIKLRHDQSRLPLISCPAARVPSCIVSSLVRNERPSNEFNPCFGSRPPPAT
jgi:hypothetical protein